MDKAQNVVLVVFYENDNREQRMWPPSSQPAGIRKANRIDATAVS